MRKVWRFIPVLAALALAHPVSAEDRASSMSEFHFDDDLVRASATQPTGSLLTTRTRGARESLVQARLHFVEELCRSVEAL